MREKAVSTRRAPLDERRRSPNQADVFELVDHTADAGADSVLVLPPFYFNQPSDEGLVRFLEPVLDRSKLPTLLYNIPQVGVTAFKSGIPGYYEWIETNQSIRRAVERIQMLRKGLGDKIDLGIDFHAKTSPSVATIICKEVEPLNLMFIEEPCPPENIKAMARIARRTTVPIATGERLVASHSCRELIEQGVVDILQCDINHVGGISALWKVGTMAEPSGVKVAPHACEGPLGGIATLHVDAAMPNFLVQEICSGIEPQQKEKSGGCGSASRRCAWSTATSRYRKSPASWLLDVSRGGSLQARDKCAIVGPIGGFPCPRIPFPGAIFSALLLLQP